MSMDLTQDYIFFILKVIPPILIVAFAMNYYRNTRVRDMREMAASLGAHISLKGPDIGELESTGINLFMTGTSRYTENFFTCPVSGDISARIFDYRYKVPAKRSIEGNMSVALIDLRKSLPRFMLKPEEFSDKLAALVGFNDIDFDSYPEFSKRYLLKGADKDGVRNFFPPEIIMFFEKRTDWCAEAAGTFIAFWKGPGYLKPENYPPFIEELKEIVPILLKK